MAASKKLSISDSLLTDIEMAFDDNSFMAEWYIDLQENTVAFIPDDLLPEQEELLEQIENDPEHERFIPILHRTSREGYAQMERFIAGLDDDHQKDVLYTAIDGRGAFRRFKDALYRVDLQDAWYEFRDRENRREVLDWLFAQDLIAEEDIEAGMELYEQQLARRKRRQANLAKMKPGATVVCSGNSGHVGQVTPGQTYEVLAVQEEHLNIRIKDDRGKTIWIPKAHFELVSEA